MDFASKNLTLGVRTIETPTTFSEVGARRVLLEQTHNALPHLATFTGSVLAQDTLWTMARSHDASVLYDVAKIPKGVDVVRVPVGDDPSLNCTGMKVVFFINAGTEFHGLTWHRSAAVKPLVVLEAYRTMTVEALRRRGVTAEIGPHHTIAIAIESAKTHPVCGEMAVYAKGEWFHIGAQYYLTHDSSAVADAIYPDVWFNGLLPPDVSGGMLDHVATFDATAFFDDMTARIADFFRLSIVSEPISEAERTEWEQVAAKMQELSWVTSAKSPDGWNAVTRDSTMEAIQSVRPGPPPVRQCPLDEKPDTTLTPATKE